MTKASAATTSPLASTPIACSGPRAVLGTLLVRFVVPLWLLAGASFKLSERNPNLLPLPVRDVVSWLHERVGASLGMNNVEFLLFSMRAMIGVELMLVGVMFFVPKLARTAAVLILSLFCVVLLAELWGTVNSRAFADKGVSVLLKPCGCFGAWSPPSIVTFAIDAVLLLGVAICRPGPKGSSAPAWPLAGVAALGSVVVGTAVAFGAPEKTMPASTGDAEPPTTAKATADDPKGAAHRAANGTAAAHGAPQPPAATAWPAAPEKLERTYFVVEKKLLGQRLDSVPLALQISRPMPESINSGRWHLIFYRKDCDHCLDVMNRFFAGDLPAPTLAIEVPDSTGRPLPMPCKKCEQHALPKGPDYVVGTPLLLTVQDGVIVGVSKDVDKPGAIEAVLGAGKPGAKQVDGALVLESSAAGPAAVDAPRAPTNVAAPAKPFPPVPAKLEAYYAPEFEKWPGKRFDEQVFAQLTARPLALDPNVGDVCVVYYRADCEHCEQLFVDHFSKTLPCPTLAIAIPDTDPANAFDMPCKECKLSTVPQGPIYVVETPVILVLKDGVVQSILSGQAAEDVTAVEAMLPKKAK